jgi:hypothetical protein
VVQARHVIAAEAADMISTKPSDATAAKATHVTPAEATDVASTETAHVTSTEAAAHVAPAKAATTAMSSTSAAAAGLGVRCNKAAGKHCACQNHHHSSSHDILHLGWADLPPQDRSDVDVPPQSRANVAIEWKWGCLFVGSTKFAFIWTEHRTRSSQTQVYAGSAARQQSRECAVGWHVHLEAQPGLRTSARATIDRCARCAVI